VTYINCSSGVNHAKSSDIQKIDVVNLDTSYINPLLLKYLINYIEEHDTIRNSWKISPIYLIRFLKEVNDTFVYITGHKVIPELLPSSGKEDLEMKGYFLIDTKPIVIVDNIKSIGTAFYNREKLNTKIESLDISRKRLRFESKTLPTYIYKIYKKDSLKYIGKKEGFILK